MTIADIQTKALKLVDATSTEITNANFLIDLNNAYEIIVGDLIALDKNWNFGDSNYTTLPTGLSNLTNATHDYQLTSGWLSIIGVKVKDVNGLWVKLEKINLNDNEPLEELQKTDGLPAYYGLREDFVSIYPAPDNGVSVTLTNGLQIVAQRTADVFTEAERAIGTKVPGFASPYHVLLSYKVALEYALSYKQDRVSFIKREIAELYSKLIKHYSLKEKDCRTIIRTKRKLFK